MGSGNARTVTGALIDGQEDRARARHSVDPLGSRVPVRNKILTGTALYDSPENGSAAPEPVA
ncbi:hypothetical protein ACFZAD_38490 [Streptomyces iakyrus]|uniref:hypothetical protein n=1 Tax=Streptomyces iakyrus TaxID=68219 RepID=UPI0036EBEC80